MDTDNKYIFSVGEKQITAEDKNFLVEFACKKWDELDSARGMNLQVARDVQDAIFPKASKKGIRMPEVYEIRETYKAHLWKSWFSSLDTMFDVQGRSFKDQQLAPAHKAFLADIFRKTGLAAKLDKALDNWIDKGEMVLFVGWTQKFRKKRVANSNGVKKNYTVESVAEYDGPDTIVVDPENFVFDSSCDFETCVKIVRSFKTPEEIAENKLYDNTEGLKNLALTKKGKGFLEDKVEILEVWGDIRLKDGAIVKNIVMTVAGRSRLIRFEENPFIQNPFIHAGYICDPANGRGISPLNIAVPLNNASQTILNLQLDALKLIINKPYLAPRGSLNGKIKVEEGSIIEYDPALMPQAPVPLDFKDAIVGWDFLSFFENKIESTTGIFKYMTGNPTGQTSKTATEATGLMTGQNVRLNKEVDILNVKVKIPLIQKTAELAANFYDFEPDVKIINQKGEAEFLKITDEAKNGEFDYVIGDSSSAAERRMKIKEALDCLWQFASNPDLNQKIKWTEVMKWTFEQLGVFDPTVFIKDEV